MAKVWFIRHGESISNANLPTTHPARSGLTEKGEQEARLIAHAFSEKPSLVAVSSFLRAQQTAAPTIAHFYPIVQETWPVHEFTYLAPERYAGTTLDERRPFAVEYWERNDPNYKDGDIGESFAELIERVAGTIARCRSQKAGLIAVFSHGLFLRALHWCLLNEETTLTADSMQRYSYFLRSLWFPNGGIMKTEFHANGRVDIEAGFDTTHMTDNQEVIIPQKP